MRASRLPRVPRRIAALLMPMLIGMGGNVGAQTAGSLELTGTGVVHTKTVPFNARFGVGAGVRVGVWLPASFQFEAQADLTRTNHFAPGTDFTMRYLGAGLVWQPPMTGAIRPYLRIGAGVLDSQEPCTAATAGTCGSFFTPSTGVGFRVPLAGALRLRAEGLVRFRPGFDYTSVGASLGVSWTPGALLTSAGPAVDTDRDGVPDRQDRCADSPIGALVDRRGCPTDFDGDGVIDGIDRCPRSEPGRPVDPFGCPVTNGSRSGYAGESREQRTGWRTVGKTS